MQSHSAQPVIGSSPLARGLLPAARRRPHRRRIIPARAGFTRIPRQEPAPARDHPRSRGVYCFATHLTGSGGGSSPLARGLRNLMIPIMINNRIIPARAGFTGRDRRLQVGARDHPRSRGVYVSRQSSSRTASGSSPLARGLPFEGGDDVDEDGIIPARAGFTHHHLGGRRRKPDHPRSRGVYPEVWAASILENGSSPLARGLLAGGPGRCRPGRIIPARAGFTPWRRARSPPKRDHPRSRGVYRGVLFRRGLRPGSSPLARGLRIMSGSFTPIRRIIPARAGFTRVRRNRMRSWSDHPRSRGVYLCPRTEVVG